MKFLDNYKFSKIQITLGIFFLCLVGIIGFSLFKVFLADTPERSTNKYLKAWKENNVNEMKKLNCFSKEVLDAPNFDVQSWDIQSWTIIETKENNENMDSKYFSIFVKVNYFYGNSSIKRTIVFDVWNSEELFEAGKRAIDSNQQSVAKILDYGNEWLGKPTESRPNNPIKREFYSLEKYCIREMKEDS